MKNHLSLDALKYLAGLNIEHLKFVVNHWHKNSEGTLEVAGEGCADAKPTTSPTPNGEWACDGKNWVWIPEIG